MNFKIKYDKLCIIFDKIMRPYSNLDFTEKSYDYYDYDKGRYADLDVVNYYLDIDDDYEEDNWVMQYQELPGDEGKDEDLPILRYSGSLFQSIEPMFEPYFQNLFKDWFKKTYNFEIKTIVKYY